MKLPELVERLGRTVFEAPFGAAEQAMSDSPEVAEIRIAVLDEVKKRVQRAGGKGLFPYNVVRIRVRAAEEFRPVFERDFFRQFFGEEVRRALAKEACRYPDDLRVEIRVVDAAGPLVECLSEDLAPVAEPAPVKRVARLSVVAGVANKPEVQLQKARTNIGRLVDVYKAEGVSRRNDLAFAADDPINRTVSREHAHILHDRKAGEYRLFNDRWYKRGEKNGNCGLWIVRDGLGQEVHRDARGTRLLPGDEIHLGKAVVRFQMK